MKTYQSPLFYYAIISLCCYFFLLIQRTFLITNEEQTIFCAIAFFTLILVSGALFFVDAEIRRLEIGKIGKWIFQFGVVALCVLFLVKLVLPVV